MTTVIYHRDDFDGLFSAAACMKFLPDAEMIGWDFGDPLIPWPDGDGPIYIVDLPPDCLEGIAVKQSGRIIWIDHHKSSIDKWDKECSLPGYRLDGVAACRLCWRWFKYGKPGNRPDQDLTHYREREVTEPLALTLAGEYDVWDKRDERADAFQFGLYAGGYGVEQCFHLLECNEQATLDTVDAGRAAMGWQKQFAESTLKSMGFVREWEGRTFCVLASCHARNSMWFPQEAIPKECDALMCWRYDGNRVSFSLYHAPGHEEHDLSPIAVKYGGGGHRGACGFSMSLEDAMAVIQ